ncbi:MAG: methylmalonyl Co-A mutase-associated GTPase MeaB [Gammaproteobacteria bacterium]|nr:methylmalonyl Co-A mutase-associated GTPase MeaB [Gammaproteobacteria bacterium]MCP4089417.1 methylmalonyl Co-A mutase-associated GTPase MeaB [Gammaproteobacteria bacterium]MCP4277532.1 methylmalonyl Co-A mutase-associated GTPase MeaB [Gammaproteobacteria bacterium]MCP4831140.1 methylmalonyl Co-A mutase-associated GTPase MeaB [Gammaproteobacteria bacterium]MCP4928563.1 methylmalonyl Co-A mutase-associated GTPase MeaB [Gammaproteobacteria bacterium]
MSAANATELAAHVLEGDRRALAQAITLIESQRPEDRNSGRLLLEELVPHSGKSVRIGISGVPGVGKSTFIESLGNHLIDQGHRVAVLAVDPSSAISGGSILGDKTRMERLSQRVEAFIRPSPAGATLGGVARRTRETMLITEAAGFDVVLVETVGVGQSETTVSRMTDMFVLMLLPGGGDELQGIKRGIVELADLILVNKADGNLELTAEQSVTDYRKALMFMHPRSANWEVPVEACSALKGEQTKSIWKIIQQFQSSRDAEGLINSNRAHQAKNWMWNEISNGLVERLKANPEVAEKAAELEQAVITNKLSPTTAADELMDIFAGK